MAPVICRLRVMEDEDVRRATSVADPTRLALWECLRFAKGRPVTTAALAKAVPDAGNGLTYQLNHLESAKLIEKVGGKGARTQWKVGEGIPLPEETTTEDLNATLAREAVERAFIDRSYSRLRRWLSEKRGPAWANTGWPRSEVVQERLLTLTPDELSELEGELLEVVNRYRNRSGDDRESVLVNITAYPVRSTV